MMPTVMTKAPLIDGAGQLIIMMRRIEKWAKEKWGFHTELLKLLKKKKYFHFF